MESEFWKVAMGAVGAAKYEMVQYFIKVKNASHKITLVTFTCV